jgi:hypothetical protein
LRAHQEERFCPHPLVLMQAADKNKDKRAQKYERITRTFCELFVL